MTIILSLIGFWSCEERDLHNQTLEENQEEISGMSSEDAGDNGTMLCDKI